jgi:hypothetical protein
MNKKIILADQLGYTNRISGDIFNIPDTDLYIQIDDRMRVIDIIKD